MCAVIAMLASLPTSGRSSGGQGTATSASAPGQERARARVIIATDDPSAVEAMVQSAGGRGLKRLPAARSVVAEVPAHSLPMLERSALVRAITPDRPIAGTLESASAIVGARWVEENLGVDGTGIGVAIIDSGITSAHADLDDGRVVHFADFVGSGTQPHDGYGHGTHVAGIIAGGGQASNRARRGLAPGAHLVVLKALDHQGQGYISDAISALDYAVEHRGTYGIRIINLSVAAGVYESYRTDPLTLAAARAVDAGIVVVTAAGNLGHNARGAVQSGGITSPGNAPWVLTVGAGNHHDTLDRTDDTVAAFSSRGPSVIDFAAKPDLVAPGVGIESLADPGSTLSTTRPADRRWGLAGAEPQYLRLSGTSMAAPVVAGTVALMLQVNAGLSPAGVKAILQATAEPNATDTRMAQGAGFLNARAAVEFAGFLAVNPGAGAALDALIALSESPATGGDALCEPGDPCAAGRLSAACDTSVDCFQARRRVHSAALGAPAIRHPPPGTSR